MRNQMRPVGIIVITAIIVVLFISNMAGCATYVPIKSVRPSTIDTSGIKFLGMSRTPFENRSGESGGEVTQIMNYLNDTAFNLISSTGRFEIVSPTDANRDGTFRGEMRSINTRVTQEQKQVVRNNVNVIVIMYTRTVSIEFRYEVINPKTELPIGQTIIKTGTASDVQEDLSILRDTVSIAKGIIDTQLKDLQRDLVPTIVSENRQLMSETSNDKEVKNLMNAALALVKQNNYQEAIRQYDDIANKYGSAAAKTNAAILRESIASESSSHAELTERFKAESNDERAANNAIDLLIQRLPAGSNIIIMETTASAAERNRLNYVVNQMINTFVETRNFRIVEANRELVNAEQQYQMSGNVSDNSIVSIGNQLGAQYIVLCSITGTGIQRQLNIRVLDVETSEIIVQENLQI